MATGHYIVGINVAKGAYPSVVDAAIATHAVTPMANIQIEAKATSPTTVQDLRAFTRIFVRAGYFEDIPTQWPKVSALWDTEPTGVIFKARAPLNTDAIVDVVRLMRSRGVDVPLLIELPPGSCDADSVNEAISALGALLPADVGFVLNTAIIHASGIPLRTMREAYNLLSAWPKDYLRLIYLNGVSGRGVAIPHAEGEVIWSGTPRAGVPELPWTGPVAHAEQKMIDIQASGVGLIVKYARHHDIPIVFEARASHNQDDITTFVRSCGRA